MKYYDACKIVEEQELYVCKFVSGKIANAEDEITNAHDTLLKYRSQVENLIQLYKYEISKFNKVTEENEKRYILLIEKIKASEETRLKFIQTNNEQFAFLFQEFTSASNEFLKVYFYIIFNFILEDEYKNG
jgi:hypothetical protein